MWPFRFIMLPVCIVYPSVSFLWLMIELIVGGMPLAADQQRNNYWRN